jgi:hypothetical protein
MEITFTKFFQTQQSFIQGSGKIVSENTTLVVPADFVSKLFLGNLNSLCILIFCAKHIGVQT